MGLKKETPCNARRDQHLNVVWSMQSMFLLALEVALSIPNAARRTKIWRINTKEMNQANTCAHEVDRRSCNASLGRLSWTVVKGRY